ncbi:hypothetical protein TRFO_40183 [Tritrichomonas foetus]|uniref:SSD domain-containing protein n=1 Tax=Tritrichomonas foetus TaxID=1144522 RepID=A0A1J4J2H3_9EUKA|nr:hypothetical protein TRFO_40183 [Tritrichomonas foetus]|eukprot:OHS93570.1 hypothetical protein TRFO_40183 [Tritrichomonas foetus]
MKTRRNQQEREEEDEQPLDVWKWVHSYSKFVYNHPWVIILLCVGFVIAMTLWLLLVYGFEIIANVCFYRWDGDSITGKWDSYLTASKVTYSSTLDKNGNSEEADPQSSQTQIGLLIYERKEGNILEIPIIQKIWQLEDELKQREGFSEHCFKMNTTDRSQVDENGCANFISFITYLKLVMGLRMNNPRPENLTKIDILTALCIPTLAASLFGHDYDPSDPASSKYLRTLIPLGLPLNGYKNKNDRFDEQKEEFSKWGAEWIKPANDFLKEKPFGVGLYNVVPFAIDKQISQVVMKQVLWLIGSFGFLFVFSVIHMKSFFASIFGVIGIFFSIPCAIAFQFGVLTIHHFDALNVIGLFLICGIGSDCVFIVFDLFRQTKHVPGVTPPLRLAFAVEHGIMALATSTSTAGVAFLAMISSGVRIMKYFGIYCFLELFFAFIFTFTFYIGILALWCRYFEDRSFKSNNNNNSENINDGDNASCWSRLFGCCRKKKEVMDERPLMVNDPSIDTMTSTVTNTNSENSGFQTVEYPYTSVYDCFAHLPVFHVQASGLHIHGYSAYEKFFHNYVVPIVYFYRMPIVVVMFILTVIFGYFTFQMQSKSELQFLGDDHFLQRAYILVSNAFTTSIQDFSFVYVWGVQKNLKKKWTNYLTADNYGEPRFDGVDIKNPEIQQYLSNMCDVMRSASFVDPSTGSDFSVCPIKILETYANSQGQPFPIPRENFTDEFMKGFQDYLGPQFINEPDSLFIGTLKRNTIGFSFDNGSLMYIAMKANMYLPADQDSSTLRVIYEETEKFALENITSKTPEGLSPGFTTSYGWLPMVVQDQLPTQAFYDALYSVCFAAITIFLATFSISYTIFVVYSMASVVFIIIGILYFCGWKIGTNEAVMISIASGFCADFIVQPMLAMAHDNSKRSIFGRLQNSITMFCSPVSSALCTTLMAAVFLFPSDILLFPPFASFLVMSGSFGILYGFVVLPALIAWLGPKHGDSLLKCCRPKRSHKKKSKNRDNAQVTLESQNSILQENQEDEV